MGSILKQETLGEPSSGEGRSRRNSSVAFRDEVEVIGEEDFYSLPDRPTRLPAVITHNESPSRRKEDYPTKRRRPRGVTDRMRHGDTRYDQRQQERRGGGPADRRSRRLNKTKDVRRNRKVASHVAMPDIRITDADHDLNELYGSDYDEVLHGMWMEEAEQQRTLYETEIQRQQQQDDSRPHEIKEEEDEEAKDYNIPRSQENEGTMTLKENYNGILPELQPRKLAWSEEENDVESDFKDRKGNTTDKRGESRKQGARERKKKRKRGSRSHPSSRDETDIEDQKVSPAIPFSNKLKRKECIQDKTLHNGGLEDTDSGGSQKYLQTKSFRRLFIPSLAV
ncbi:MAP7 domain-containing protein 2-like [Scylla paramamosain]|uniref:MAP7 domain-containing protein 2-like n=1 Tax=Scylla paramamosain TaxID=85552 RepID=UPI003083CD33